MVISIGSDHGGYLLKEKVSKYLQEAGHTVIDHGTNSPDSVDYPSFGSLVCKDVQAKKSDFGILICTTGVGMTIVANKYRSIRAALVSNIDIAKMTRLHNDSNVLCLGAKYTSPQEAQEFTKVFINTEFEGGRHQRRVDMITKLEDEQCQKEN